MTIFIWLTLSVIAGVLVALVMGWLEEWRD